MSLRVWEIETYLGEQICEEESWIAIEALDQIGARYRPMRINRVQIRA